MNGDFGSVLARGSSPDLSPIGDAFLEGEDPEMSLDAIMEAAVDWTQGADGFQASGKMEGYRALADRASPSSRLATSEDSSPKTVAKQWVDTRPSPTLRATKEFSQTRVGGSDVLSLSATTVEQVKPKWKPAVLRTSSQQSASAPSSPAVTERKWVSATTPSTSRAGSSNNSPATSRLAGQKEVRSTEALDPKKQMECMKGFSELHNNLSAKITEMKALNTLPLSKETKALVGDIIECMTSLRASLSSACTQGMGASGPVQALDRMYDILADARAKEKNPEEVGKFNEKFVSYREAYETAYASVKDPQALNKCCSSLNVEGVFGKLADSLSKLEGSLTREKEKMTDKEKTGSAEEYYAMQGKPAGGTNVSKAINLSVQGVINFMTNSMTKVAERILENTQDQGDKATLQAACTKLTALLGKMNE